jgi:cell division protein FtsW (lipid II flippase)
MTALRPLLLRVLTTRVAWPILITIALLCTASLFALQTSSPVRAEKQKIWLLVGAAVILVSLLPHFHVLGRIAYALYGVTIFLLIAVFAAPEVAYTHRWFVLPGDVQFQPSELAKIAFVLALAWYLRHKKNIRSLDGLVVPFLLALAPFGLILIEPDLGTALLFPLVLYAMLIAAGARLRHLIAIALVALLAMPGAYPFLKPYQQQRLKSMVLQVMGKADDTHRNGPGFQQFQSITAIGAGGVTGQGQEAAQHFRQGILPEAYTDFIFAVVGAQWGFLGCLLIQLMYLAFFTAAVEIAASTKDHFGRLLVVGLAAMILFQATINMYMTTGLGPVTGIALPFVSYGGSSLLASLLAAGILVIVSFRRK